MVIAWDPNPAPNITAYRVFVGTVSGSYAEIFDVPGGQSSFVYPGAVNGRRYYVAVAAQSDNEIWGPRSTEVSAVASAASETAPLGAAARPVSAGLAGASAGTASLESTRIEVIASGLEPVTSLAVSAAGVGLLVEGGRTVRLFEPRGMLAAPALVADGDVQIRDLALDAAFDDNGRAVLAASRPSRHGGREITIERHRLRGGGLGESTAVVMGLPDSSAARTRLATTADGRLLIAQSGLVHTVNRDAVTSLPTAVAQPSSVLWNDATRTIWVTGADASGVMRAERFEETGMAREIGVLPAPMAEAATVAHEGVSRRVTIAAAAPDALVEFDPAAGSLQQISASLARYGQPVLLTAPGSTQAWYVVLRAKRPDGSLADTVVRVVAETSAR